MYFFISLKRNFEFHQGVEDRHFVFAIDQRQGIAEASIIKALLRNTSFVHRILSSG